MLGPIEASPSTLVDLLPFFLLFLAACSNQPLFIEQHELACRAARSSRRGWAEGLRWRMTLDPVAAREFLTDPSKLLQVDLPFIKELQKQAPVPCHCFSLFCIFHLFLFLASRYYRYT